MKPVFVHPALQGLETGSKEWFAAQKRMIRAKPLVRRCYDLWYARLLEDSDSVPPEHRGAPIVELGSGSSYIKELRPEIVTSDVAPGIAEMLIDARELPFENATVRALLLTHVFHHIPDVGRFLEEACRVLVPGGVVGLVDETHTPFARWFFSKVHPEPYDDRAENWAFTQSDAMLDSNQALSWIVFWRDGEKFRARFPGLALERFEYLPWFSYLMSGGVNLRSFVPGPLTPLMAVMDRILRPLDSVCAIHWHLALRKKLR